MLPDEFATLVRSLQSMGLEVLDADPTSETIVVRVPKAR